MFFMKRRFKLILSFIIWLFSRVYTYNLHAWLIGKRNGIYTIWIRNFMGQVGEECKFQYPLRLQGGGNLRICIGPRTLIQSYSILGCWDHYGENVSYKPEIKIGSDCCIGEFSHITACNRVVIGNGLLTGRFVYIGDNAHGRFSKEEFNIPPVKRNLFSKGEVVIGNNVWLGDKVAVLSGVHIGDGAVVAANAVVTKDIPPYSLAAGVPAKVIKQIKKENE